MTHDEVKTYSRGGNFRDWENKPKQHRMQVAHYQYTKQIRDTPGYWKGLSAFGQTDEIHPRDLEQWTQTLETQPDELPGLEEQEQREVLARNPAALEIVKRIFVVLQKGLRYYDAENALHEWRAPVAVALSHGGRVNIRIPSVEEGGDPDEFFNWLTGGETGREEAGMHERLAGTHRVAVGENTQDERGSFQEKTGFGAALMAGIGRLRNISLEKGTTTHYGLDLPVGGLGNRDIHGDVILPDGRYGHLYIGYKPPTVRRDGALLIGCETDAPGKTNVLGHYHGARATSAEFSSTGGAKADKIGKAIGGMMVDLAGIGNDWLDQLKEMEQDVEAGRITSRELVGEKPGQD
jgi:hypothetical protein